MVRIHALGLKYLLEPRREMVLADHHDTLDPAVRRDELREHEARLEDHEDVGGVPVHGVGPAVLHVGRHGVAGVVGHGRVCDHLAHPVVLRLSHEAVQAQQALGHIVQVNKDQGPRLGEVGLILLGRFGDGLLQAPWVGGPQPPVALVPGLRRGLHREGLGALAPPPGLHAAEGDGVLKLRLVDGARAKYLFVFRRGDPVLLRHLVQHRALVLEATHPSLVAVVRRDRDPWRHRPPAAEPRRQLDARERPQYPRSRRPQASRGLCEDHAHHRCPPPA
mmetsp:Transcript_1959/g.7164  ORF Transcript_1959/g.7164 Transcript_1959/m.7164 type:complete len:277 (-) Transcript_1959:29-859(-)